MGHYKRYKLNGVTWAPYTWPKINGFAWGYFTLLIGGKGPNLLDRAQVFGNVWLAGVTNADPRILGNLGSRLTNW